MAELTSISLLYLYAFDEQEAEFQLDFIFAITCKCHCTWAVQLGAGDVFSAIGEAQESFSCRPRGGQKSPEIKPSGFSA